MKVTGYKLRGALQRWQLKKDAAAAQFKDSLMAFPGEQKATPRELSQTIVACEEAIAALQTVQGEYNLHVRVNVHGHGAVNPSLMFAIKALGGIERNCKMWTDASRLKRDRYASMREDGGNTRKKDSDVATRTISFDEAATLAAQWTRTRQAYTEAIAAANATELDIDFPPGLLD